MCDQLGELNLANIEQRHACCTLWNRVLRSLTNFLKKGTVSLQWSCSAHIFSCHMFSLIGKPDLFQWSARRNLPISAPKPCRRMPLGETIAENGPNIWQYSNNFSDQNLNFFGIIWFFPFVFSQELMDATKELQTLQIQAWGPARRSGRRNFTTVQNSFHSKSSWSSSFFSDRWGWRTLDQSRPRNCHV